MPRPNATANRHITMTVPWSERGDFVVEMLKELVDQGYRLNTSRAIFETLEEFFEKYTSDGLYERVNDRVANEARREERRKDRRYREYRLPGGDGYVETPD